jgi:hypothetical protein
MVFSMRNNRDGSKPVVTRKDITLARDQAVGKPTVNQDQILRGSLARALWRWRSP